MSLSLSTLITSIAALAAVVALVFLSGRVARQAGIAGLRKSARLVNRDVLALDRSRSLRIVSCDGRDLLLLVGGGADVVIGWLPAPGAVE